MLRLAVATAEETFERMQEPLAERGIEASHVQSRGRTIDLDHSPYDAFDVGFVYPPREIEGAVVDAHLDVPWVNDSAAVLRSRNKAAVLARLSGAGIPTPATVLVSHETDETDLVATFDRFDPPVVVKPTSTTRGLGIAKIHDLDSFLGMLDYVDLVHDFRATGDKSFLVQEFVPDARDLRVMVLDGEYAGAVERRQRGDDASSAPASDSDGWKHNVHRGAEAVGIDLEPDLQALAERVATELDVPYLGVDLLVTDDRVLVSETAARPTIDDVAKYEDGFWDRLAALIRRTADTE